MCVEKVTKFIETEIGEYFADTKIVWLFANKMERTVISLKK